MTVLRARALNAQGQPVPGKTAVLEAFTGNRYRNPYNGPSAARGLTATSGSDGWMQWTLPDPLVRPGPKGLYWVITGLETAPVVAATQPSEGTVTLDAAHRVGTIDPGTGTLIPVPPAAPAPAVDTEAQATAAAQAAVTPLTTGAPTSLDTFAEVAAVLNGRLSDPVLRAAYVPRPTGGTDGQALVKSGTDIVWGSGGGGGRAAYLGPVANRGRIPAGTIGSSTYQQVKTWRVYRATDRIDATALIYPGFAGLNEQGATASGTVSAVVEYPMGTFTRVKFGGADTGTIPARGMKQSDLTTLAASIPAGARFWIGTFVTWAAGLQMPRFQDGLTFDSAAATAMRESAQAASTLTLTDDLMTGTRANGNISSKTGDTYGPCAILGMTQKPTVFIAGDSRAMGQFPPVTSSQDAEGITGEVEQILGNRVGYINAGLNSDSHSLANAAGAYANRLALSQFCTHIIDQYGVNSIYGQTVSQNTTDLTTFRSKFPAGKPYYKTTTTPKVTGNWILADLSDQTPVTVLTNYTGWNTFIRNGANGLIDGCIDLEAVTSASVNSGKIAPAQKVVTDAAMTAASGVLTSATAGFQPGDVGKFVAVLGAGASGATLYGLISVVTNTTTVTLTANDSSALTATTTVSGATAGIGLSSYDGVHQTRLRETAIRESQLLQRVVGPILAALR